jgi:hypothetical protein
MATQTRTWYCCIIVDVAPLATRMNGKHFRKEQHAYVAQLDDAGEQWMLFDGRRYAAALTKDQAKAALETERWQGKPLLAPKDMERRFLRAVYGQSITRTRTGRFW